MASDDVDDATAAAGAPQGSWWARGWAWCVRRRSQLAVLGALVAVAAAVVGWVQAPELYVGVRDEAARVQAIVTTRASVLAALAGLGALVTIGINYRNSRTQLRNAEIATQTLATAQKTFQITERGHLTDRYAKAIEQLGDAEHLPIRLGGVYALQQLALDTTVLGDRATVREVLAAFVRTTAGDRHAGRSLGPIGAPAPTVDTGAGTSAGGAPAWPPIDVQAAATVLGRIHRPGEPRADLRRLEARTADLVGVDLTGADLSDADLTRADLTGARLVRTNLTGARLTGADLTRADLSDARLVSAELASAELADANLTRANLNRANLARANLTGARLPGAGLARADVTEAVLVRADLTGTGITDQQRKSARWWASGSP